MGLRSNLFVKTFIGFWLATIAILASWMLSSHYFETSRNDEHPGVHDGLPTHRGPPPRFILKTLYELQHAPRSELPDMLGELRERYGVDVYLLRSDGSDLLQRSVPRWVNRLAARLASGQRRVLETVRGRHLSGHLVHMDDEGLVRAVFVIPRPARGLLRALGDNLWLRVALAMLVSGMVCFLLSRLMTRRLKELGRASRRLAEGDLDTRLRVRDRGGDETDELARDFNTMAAQLQARINEQKRLVSDVSHELRSPLARLRVALALAEEDPDNLSSHLARIERETGRLDALIDQLLSTGPGSPVLDTHIDLVALLQQLCTDTGFEGRSRDVSVRFESAPAQAVIASTSDLLHRCFDNILRNALGHSPPGAEILVALREGPDGYEVTIDDQGPGVPHAQLDSIFNEFYRLDPARSRESGGYGLGLAIARRAVQRHGGTIRAENSGQGLRVTVSLPREAGGNNAAATLD